MGLRFTTLETPTFSLAFGPSYKVSGPGFSIWAIPGKGRGPSASRIPQYLRISHGTVILTSVPGEMRLQYGTRGVA